MMVVVAEVPVAVVVRVMIMLKFAVLSLPVPHEKHPSIVARSNPVSAWIRRTSPVACMPPIVILLRVPIAIDPDELRRRP